ncbi:MAG: GNAT family N-acetyltransferase [Chlamydiales bacterium]|nr:GNAT family N-acetyltransferase [Chlamydiales bacterium]
MSQYSIRRMHESEVQIAIDWAKQEGWNPGLNDAHCFYQADPKGFFMGFLDDVPIAVGSAVAYDEHYAFCGLYIVKKEFRKQGYGLQLTEERLKYVGNRITGIDGVIENIHLYEKLGYVASHKNIRYEWLSPPSLTPSKSIVNLQSIPFSQLEDFDLKYFLAPRSNFLKCWIHPINGHALGYLEAKELNGYGVIRPCYHGYKIGPLFAKSYEIAQALFEALCTKADGGPIYLDIPENNKEAIVLVQNYKMIPKFEVMRMYRNGIPRTNHQNGIYGITTFELG